MPLGLSTSTISPTFLFIIAFAIGLSLEILLIKGSASWLPTIWYSSVSSSSSTYLIDTVVSNRVAGVPIELDYNIYGNNILMIIAAVIFGIGHIGIHLNHYKESVTEKVNIKKKVLKIILIFIGIIVSPSIWKSIAILYCILIDTE